MPDILIRNLPADELEQIDAKAERLGLSRVEYIRRRLQQDAAAAMLTVRVDDLERFSRVFQDLLDEDVMRDAWR